MSGISISSPTAGRLLPDTSKHTGSRRLGSPAGYRKGREPRSTDIFIAVMGVTGAGKSSFIKLATGREDVKVGHGLESCTSAVEVHAYDAAPDQTIYLIDTPGFDDTTRSDTEVLKDIASWIRASYRDQICLHGIIYMHRISDPRLQASAKKNLRIFKKLCGQDALSKVILVTTIWDKVENKEGEAREKELIGTREVWGYMMERGSTHCRHLNTAASARDIIQRLSHGPAIATVLQRELVDERLPLSQTSAGQELKSEIRTETSVLAHKLEETEAEMEEALQENDKEAVDAIREERDRFALRIDELEERTASLHLTLESLLNERDERLASLEHQLTQNQVAEEARLAAEEARRVAEEEFRVATPTSSLTLPMPVESSPITVVLHKNIFVGLSPKQNHSNFISLSKDLVASMDRISMNITSPRPAWLVRVSGPSGHKYWTSSADFSTDESIGGRRIVDDDAETLDLCILSLGWSYRQWTSGTHRWPTVGMNHKQESFVKRYQHRHLHTLAFGRKDTFCVSYAAPGSGKLVCGFMLDSYYSVLNKFLELRQKSISLHAVTLDGNGTDFIAIYCLDGDEDHLQAIWKIKDTDVMAMVTRWCIAVGITPYDELQPRPRRRAHQNAALFMGGSQV